MVYPPQSPPVNSTVAGAAVHGMGENYVRALGGKR